MAKVKLFTLAQVPPELANKWLQHLRDFDTANPDCHFEVMADTPDLPLAEIIKIVTVDPPMKFQDFFKREKK